MLPTTKAACKNCRVGGLWRSKLEEWTPRFNWLGWRSWRRSVTDVEISSVGLHLFDSDFQSCASYGAWSSIPSKCSRSHAPPLSSLFVARPNMGMCGLHLPTSIYRAWWGGGHMVVAPCPNCAYSPGFAFLDAQLVYELVVCDDCFIGLFSVDNQDPGCLFARSRM